MQGCLLRLRVSGSAVVDSLVSRHTYMERLRPYTLCRVSTKRVVDLLELCRPVWSPCIHDGSGSTSNHTVSKRLEVSLALFVVGSLNRCGIRACVPLVNAPVGQQDF